MMHLTADGVGVMVFEIRHVAATVRNQGYMEQGQ